MQEGTALEAVLRRDRVIVLGGLVVISALAWAYLGYMAWEMGAVDMAMQMAMPRMRVWSAVDIFLLFVMWVVMMVAMMVPTAASMVLTYAAFNRRQQAQEEPFASTAVFLAGYLVVWTGFSALATLAQWGLHEVALLSPMMVSTSPLLGGVLLLGAGIFQWTPWKYTCLKHCRSPLGFLMTEWRDGAWGAFWMGLSHGSYCTGCCWFLMALLFVAGVMNLLWVAAITAFVLVEKMVPRGDLVGRVAGGVLVMAGIVLLSQMW